MKIKLTDQAVQRLTAPPGERIDVFDASYRGFGLRVSGPPPAHPNHPCRKSWFLFYRHKGKQKRLTLEPVYPALGLAAARKKAGDALAALSDGKDPNAEKRIAKAAAEAEAETDSAKSRHAIETAIDDFIRLGLERKKRAPRYIEETRRNFDNHVLPRWRGRDIRQITRLEVNELLDAIADGGSDVVDEDGDKRHVAGGPIAANRVLAGVRALFNWSLRRGLIESTPVALVERPGEETRRERTLTAQEIEALWPQFKAVGYPFGTFYAMALVTGQRREQVAAMRWDEIDMAERVWAIPSTRTKSGRPHMVPLSPLAMELLAEAKRIFGNASEFVFTTRGKTAISGYSKAKAALDAAVSAARKKAKLKDIQPWTTHDLRRTAATEMARLGVSRFMIARVLNHADREVTGIYDRHSYLPETRHALETWARFLGDLINPPTAKVETLAKRRAAR